MNLPQLSFWIKSQGWLKEWTVPHRKTDRGHQLCLLHRGVGHLSQCLNDHHSESWPVHWDLLMVGNPIISLQDSSDPNPL